MLAPVKLKSTLARRQVLLVEVRSDEVAACRLQWEDDAASRSQAAEWERELQVEFLQRDTPWSAPDEQAQHQGRLLQVQEAQSERPRGRWVLVLQEDGATALPR